MFDPYLLETNAFEPAFEPRRRNTLEQSVQLFRGPGTRPSSSGDRRWGGYVLNANPNPTPILVRV